MSAEERIKLFGMSHALAERDLDKLEARLGLDLQRGDGGREDDEYYPQFGEALRAEAAGMGERYELFYCLERSIRKLVADTLESQNGKAWWTSVVPQNIRDNVQKNMQREIDSGFTLRSENEIEFTTFGELGEIVRANWPAFDALFASQKAFSNIMTSLNMLRGPIAHCCPLAEDEILRLDLTVRDWFRLMA
jgi:hypothetical protein